MKRPLLALLVALVLAATARAEDWDARLRAAGYVDLQLLIPGLRVELKYATSTTASPAPSSTPTPPVSSAAPTSCSASSAPTSPCSSTMPRGP